MTALGSSGWRGRSLLDVTHRRGYRSRGRTLVSGSSRVLPESSDTPNPLVSGLSACDNESGPDGATNAICPGLTPSERG